MCTIIVLRCDTRIALSESITSIVIFDIFALKHIFLSIFDA